MSHAAGSEATPPQKKKNTQTKKKQNKKYSVRNYLLLFKKVRVLTKYLSTKIAFSSKRVQIILLILLFSIT